MSKPHHLVNFDNNNIGTVDNKKLFKSLPEGTTKTEYLHAALLVDDFRITATAKIMDEAIDHAESVGIGDGKGTGVSVLPFMIGGHTTCEVVIDSNFNVISEVKHTNTNELMSAVLERAATLFNKHGAIQEIHDEPSSDDLTSSSVRRSVF